MAKFKCTHCYKTFKCDVPLKVFDETVCRECYDAYFAFVDKTNHYGGMATIEPQEDIINKPNHYHKNEIDVNGYLEKHFPKQANVTVAEGFYIGNVIKYVSRHKEKGGLQDLEKAMFNLNKLVELNRQ